MFSACVHRYPSSEMKLEMAKAVIHAFPTLHSGNNVLHGCVCHGVLLPTRLEYLQCTVATGGYVFQTCYNEL